MVFSLVTFSIYGSSCYFNMGVLCIFSTLFVLLINGDLNGPTIGAIFPWQALDATEKFS